MIKRFSPLYIFVGWLILHLIFDSIGFFYLALTTPGSAEKPLEFLAITIIVFLYGVLVICIAIFYANKIWAKKHRIFLIGLFLVCLFVIVLSCIKKNKDTGFLKKEYIKMEMGELEKITTYYDSQLTRIKSISFYLNGRRDSTWMFYTESGEVIKSIKYRNDKLP